VNRYLLKHETASPELYKYSAPGLPLDRRVTCLRTLKELGFETGAGNMVGLPGQTHEISGGRFAAYAAYRRGHVGIGRSSPTRTRRWPESATTISN
jgi:biotin synthase